MGGEGFVVYDVKTKIEKFIKDGKITGVSKDGTQIFYMMNNRFLMPIP